MDHPYRYRARGFVYALLFSLFAIIAVAALLFARGYTFDPQLGLVANTGLLVLNSTPANATISVDGETRSERTDARLRLDPGTYDVRVERVGTIPYQKRVSVVAGEATLEEDILLFQTEPERKLLAPGGVAHVALSSDERVTAFLVRARTGLELWTAPLRGDDTAKRLAALPAAIAPITSFAYASDGTRVLISTPKRTVIYSSNGELVADLAVGGDVRFAGRRSDAVVSRVGPTIRLTDTGGRQSILVGRATTWTVTNDAVVAGRDSEVIRAEFDAPAQRFATLPANVSSLSSPARDEAVFALTRDRRLFLLTRGAVVPVDTGVDAYDPGFSGESVAIVGDREVRVWERDTGRTELVTRFSNPPDTIVTVDDGHHVLYAQDGQLRVIAADGTNDLLLGTVGKRLLVTGQTTQIRLDADTGRLESIMLLDR